MNQYNLNTILNYIQAYTSKGRIRKNASDDDAPKARVNNKINFKKSID